MNIFDVGALSHNVAKNAYDKSEALIAQLLELLEQGYVLKIGLSGGKDSSVVTNASIEAMRRAISTGLIESERPLVIVTVDTLLEPYNVSMYIPYAHAHIRTACETASINLHMTICSPPIYQQLMVLFAGTQKLFTSAASGRNADCSVIFKLDSSKRAVNTIKKSLPNRYQNAPWINLSGSRTDESARRKMNMAARNEVGLRAQGLIERIKNDSKSTGQTYSFSPIEDWVTSDVIEYLSHAGTNPIKTTPFQIASYHRNFGLLLAVYGEGSNDVCEFGSEGKSTACNGVARFGCQVCGMVKDDKSGLEVIQYPRWGRFGDDVLRFREYFIRASLDVKSRAYHPRASCGVTSSVYLQPNVLKSTVLERLIYLASQITRKQREVHREFLNAFNDGTLNDDVGIKDIMSDPALSSDVREQYLEAYIDRMKDRPMLELFSEKHATILSALWSLHGAKSAPYRPMKIFDEVVNKGKSKPFPLMNDELNAARHALGLLPWDSPEVLEKDIPEAKVFELFESAKPFDPTINDKAALSHWLPLDFDAYLSTRPSELSWSADGSRAGRNQRRPFYACKLKVKFTNDGETQKVRATQALSGRIFPISENSEAYHELLELGAKKYAQACDEMAIEYNQSSEEITQTLIKQDGAITVEFVTEVPWCEQFVSAYPVVIEQAKTRSTTGIRFSQRKRIKGESGRLIGGRSSLRDYRPQLSSQLGQQHERSVSYWLPNLTQVQAQRFTLEDYDLNPTSIHEMDVSIAFDDARFDEFMKDEWGRAISMHDQFVAQGFATRQRSRRYEGTQAFHFLMNCSGVIISKSFESFVQRCLCRTEQFHTSGLFNLSDLSSERLTTIQHVIPMEVHRSRKANQLLAVRRYRNINRRSVQNQLKSIDNPSVIGKRVAGRFIEFFKHYESIATANAMHLSYITLSGKKTSLGKMTTMWLTEFGSKINDFSLLYKLLTDGCEREYLERDLSSLRTVFNVYRRLVGESSSQICDDIATVEQGIAEAMSTLTADSFHDDGMGNMELVDESILTGVARAYVNAGVTRNTFLTLMGFTQRLAIMKGAKSGDSELVKELMTATVGTLSNQRKSLEVQSSSLDFGKMLRIAIPLTTRTSGLSKLSEERANLLALLRAS